MVFTDVDLSDEPVERTSSAADRRRRAHARDHHQHQQQQALISSSSTDDDDASVASNNSIGTTSKHKSCRTYGLSIKRPRRNVKKRSIYTSLSDIDEGREAEFLEEHGHDPIDSYRAPRIALALFMLVCFTGGYRGMKDYWSTGDSFALRGRGGSSNSNAAEVGREGEHHRETLLSLADGSNSTATIQNIEEMPTILFDDEIQAPEQLSNLVNIFSQPYNPQANKLFFWHIPRSGSTTMTRIAGYCLGLTIASQHGKREVSSLVGGGGENDNDKGAAAAAGGGNGGVNELRINESEFGKYANVDMSNPAGIELAKSFNVGSSSDIDLLSSPYLWDAAGVFDEEHQGYMIAMIRHPIERATSLYYSMRKNKQFEKQMQGLTSIDQYAKSSLAENNWMTRFLSNTLSGELTPEHEAIAKEVLRTKCLIGLLQDKTETMRRLDILFNIRAIEKTQVREECQEKLLYWDWPGKNRHDPVEPGSEAWVALEKHNTFDLRLFEYAQQLFVAQGKLFQAIPSTW